MTKLSYSSQQNVCLKFPGIISNCCTVPGVFVIIPQNMVHLFPILTRQVFSFPLAANHLIYFLLANLVLSFLLAATLVFCLPSGQSNASSLLIIDHMFLFPICCSFLHMFSFKFLSSQSYVFLLPSSQSGGFLTLSNQSGEKGQETTS